jgi:hypothetical protein
MKKSRILFFVLLSIAVFAFFSCRHEPVLLPDTATVCFQEQVLPLINSNCAIADCHDASSEASLAGYNNIIGYVTPGKPNKSKIYELITTTSLLREFMPPSPQSPLTQNQINLISIWILQGAENNTCPEPPCDSVYVTFNGTVFPIIQDNCYGCHSGSNPGGGIYLTDYNQVRIAGGIPEGSLGSLLGTITHNPLNAFMPKNLGQLSDCKIAQIRIWIQDGMPNN